MNKTLNVFVVDRNGTPIPGAEVVASDGGVQIGSGTTTGSRNRPVGLQLDEAYQSIEVSVKYGKLKKGPISVDLATRNFEVMFEEVSLPRQNTGPAIWEKIAAFAFGVVFVLVLLGVAFAAPNPTDFQLFVFRIVLALAAAGVAAVIPGFFNIDRKTTLYAIR